MKAAVRQAEKEAHTLAADAGHANKVAAASCLISINLVLAASMQQWPQAKKWVTLEHGLSRLIRTCLQYLPFSCDHKQLNLALDTLLEVSAIFVATAAAYPHGSWESLCCQVRMLGGVGHANMRISATFEALVG